MREIFMPVACIVAASHMIIGFASTSHAQSSQPAFEIAQAERAGTTRYIVRPGDTLYSIARNAGVTVSVILDLNPEFDAQSVEVGDVVLVPGDFIPVRRERLSINPQSGRPGTEVELRGRGFRPHARLRVLAGRSPYSLSRIDRVRADRRGRVDIPVALPEWARPGRRVFFALQTIDGQSRAVAGPFRVVGRPSPSERLVVSGTLTKGGVECPLLRSDDGRVYSLTGDIEGFGPGDRVLVEGRLAEVSICMQGQALQVRRISEAQ
jgi:LysM repeat protein